MVYHTHSTCFGLTEQLKQLRIMPHGYGTGEMTAVERTPTCGGTVPHRATDHLHSIALGPVHIMRACVQ